MRISQGASMIDHTRMCHQPAKLTFLCNILGNDHSAHVVAASRTDHVRWQRCAALWANREVLGLQKVVGTTFVGSRVGVFSFWNSHASVLVNFFKGLIRLRFVAFETAKVTRCSPRLQPVIAISYPQAIKTTKKTQTIGISSD